MIPLKRPARDEHTEHPDEQRRWNVVAASVCGVGHQRNHEPCQDAHAWACLDGGVLLAAVADGAGSAPLAEIGAAVAARAAVDSLCASCAQTAPRQAEGCETLLYGAMETARSQVRARSAELGVALGDLAATLIVVLATPGYVAAAQIGDGAVVVSTPTGGLMTLTKPQSGEHINETFFLTCENPRETAVTRSYIGRAAHIALFSDGLQMLAMHMPQARPHTRFFEPLFRFVMNANDSENAAQQLRALLCSNRVTSRTDDDTTLLLAGFR